MRRRDGFDDGALAIALGRIDDDRRRVRRVRRREPWLGIESARSDALQSTRDVLHHLLG